MSNLQDLSHLIGKKFNYFTVLEDLGMVQVTWQEDKERQFKVQCVCGEIKDIRYYEVIHNRTKSCGCRGIIKDWKQHPLQDVYHTIKQRCYNKLDDDYNNYGARGIVMCDEWLSSAKVFLEWCLNNGWKKGLQIDRTDNYGNYGPDNCRFVDSKINNRNRRSNRLISFGNETMCITEWAEKTGIYKQVLLFRINKGWPLDKVFNKPVNTHKQKLQP